MTRVPSPRPQNIQGRLDLLGVGQLAVVGLSEGHHRRGKSRGYRERREAAEKGTRQAVSSAAAVM